MRQFPPFIKGYLRVGGYVGEGVSVDHEFNCLDVCIIVKRETVTQRYSTDTPLDEGF